MTVFKVKWGNLTLKIYDKGARVLRVEVVVHNAKELRCGKLLEKLPLLLERMRAMLVRFLDTVQVAHINFLDLGTFEKLSEPSRVGSRRLAGINLENARNRNVINAVVELSTAPNGFTLSQLAEKMRSLLKDQEYSTRNAAYDLAKMRGKKLVQRRNKSRRYEASTTGVRILCAYQILREKVIKPILAGINYRCDRPPKIVQPLDQHYMNLRHELEKTFETIGFAVQNCEFTSDNLLLIVFWLETNMGNQAGSCIFLRNQNKPTMNASIPNPASGCPVASRSGAIKSDV